MSAIFFLEILDLNIFKDLDFASYLVNKFRKYMCFRNSIFNSDITQTPYKFFKLKGVLLFRIDF